MQTLTYTVEKEENGQTVKTVLQRRGVSTGTLRRLKQTDGILMNQQAVTVRHKVTQGQTITLQLPETPSEFVKPVPLDLEIVYEDDGVLVVNKPSGMPVHPSAGHHNDSLANAVAYYMRDTDFTFRPITRLDRYTSGLVLIAKNSVAAANLCKQIGEGSIQKTYYAVTEGVPNPLQGEIIGSIAREENSVLKRRVSPLGKPAKTLYRVEQIKDDLALVRAIPVTGRTHQIRVHFASLGCPLLYDFLYGEEQENQMFLLQCTGLTFTHPHTGKEIILEIPCVLWK